MWYIRKWRLSILKVLELFRPNLSMKKKRFLSMNPPEFLEQVLAFKKSPSSDSVVGHSFMRLSC